MRIKRDARFELKFQAILGRFWTPKMDPKRAQKSLKNLTWAPRGPPGTPRAARRPLVSHFGAFLDQCWSHFWTRNGAMLGTIWNPAASLFRRSRYLLALPVLLPLRPCTVGSAGARVSAYNSTHCLSVFLVFFLCCWPFFGFLK